MDLSFLKIYFLNAKACFLFINEIEIKIFQKAALVVNLILWNLFDINFQNFLFTEKNNLDQKMISFKTLFSEKSVLRKNKKSI